MHGEKYRVSNAWYNAGKRPAYAMSCEAAKIRYMERGMDHALSINELKDKLFKLKELMTISKIKGVQYPYVHRQYNNVQLPSIFKVETVPLPIIKSPRVWFESAMHW
eukprot:GHVR01167012.1.p1 GENE.GHVR01167012.1~~GHVR01167012.1.p1  ORF type:complete len:107 (+),score=23.11 GHVR01167012.1:338-658(+)